MLPRSLDVRHASSSLNGTDRFVPLVVGRSRRWLWPTTLADRRDDRGRATFGSCLIWNAFAMGWTSRATVLVAPVHGDAPSRPHCPEQSADNADDPSSRAAPGRTCASVKERTRRRGDDHIALTRRSLGRLDVLHVTVVAPARSARGKCRFLPSVSLPSRCRGGDGISDEWTMSLKNDLIQLEPLSGRR